MKKIVLIGVLLLSSGLTWADNNDQLLDEAACTETKEGVGYFLGVADYLFNEIEKQEHTTQTEGEKKAKEKELYEGAIAFSQLAANYSTVYKVWCK